MLEEDIIVDISNNQLEKFSPPEDIWQRLEIFFIVTTGEVLLTSSG